MTATLFGLSAAAAGALTGCDRNLNAFVVGGVVIKPRGACVNAAHRLEID